MEAFVALSIACNIKQIVEQAMTVGKANRQIYKGGVTTGNFNLQKYVQTLQEGNKLL